MKKPTMIINYTLYLHYICPETNNKVKFSSDKFTLYASEQECELCGGHGHIRLMLDVKCPECNKVHPHIELLKW